MRKRISQAQQEIGIHFEDDPEDEFALRFEKIRRSKLLRILNKENKKSDADKVSYERHMQALRR